MMLKFSIFTILLVKIISISSDKQYGSLTFVIDDTYSMYTEIDLVKHAATRFMDIVLLKSTSQIKDIVVVTFNDPEKFTKVRLPQSRNRETVKNALDAIKVYGGGDCPEYSLSGITTGLLESRRDSYLFVFTDASPKDGYIVRWDSSRGNYKIKDTKKINDLIKLAQSRGSQVFFFLTKSGTCGEQKILFEPYWEIAAATNGQVFKLSNKQDVADLLKFLEILISGEGDTITRVDVPPNTRTSVPFTIDDQTEYVLVSAASSGDRVDLDITKGPTLNYEKIAWLDNNKILKINNPAPGHYEATVLGSSETTVMIFGRTDFTFQHGFSERIPTTFTGDKKQPTEGTQSVLLLKINDPTHSVNIKSVELTSLDGKTVYHSALLRKQTDDYYTTDLFVPPNSMFLITVIGEGKKTKKEIKRTAKTPIEPRPRDTDPVVTIQGGGSFAYGGNVELTCNVKAYPKPVITWKDSKGNILTASSVVQTSKYDHISTVSIRNLIRKAAYSCFAQVGVNENSDRVDLDVISPFTVDAGDKAKTSISVDFENPAVLQCNIKSKIPIHIAWYHYKENNDYELLKDSSEYKISKDGTQITVNKVKLGNEGKYVCVAYLPSDRDTKYQLDREIKINHAAPVVGEPVTVRVNENESVNIKCIILNAYPPPKIEWQVNEPGTNYFRVLQQNGEILRIVRASLNSAGVYRCIARNDKGSKSHDTTVVVLTKPKVTLFINDEQKKSVNIEYNTDVKLSCHVISHSRPEIVWKNGKNEVMKADKTDSKLNDYRSYLTISQVRRTETFTCVARNEIAVNSASASIVVNTPFIQEKPSDTITQVKYGEEATIKCGVTSRVPFKVVWQKDTGEFIQGSDKYFLSEDGTILKIKQVKLDTRGKYTCKISVVGDESVHATHNTNLEATTEKPMIERQPDVTVLRNQTAVIKCHVLKGLPKPIISWMVKKEKMTAFTATSEKGEELTIRLAQYEDTGLYKCVAKNDDGADEKTVKLTVEGPPQILSDEDRLYTAVVGDVTLRIPCVTVGYPKPDITWPTDAIYPASKLRIDTDGTIIINNPQVEDSKNYTCKATNKFGSVEKTFEASVTKFIDNDQDFGDTTYVDLLTGESRKLNCASGSIKGRWYREGYFMNLMGPLTISDANANHEGNYTCRVSDSSGSTSHTYVVTVGYPPKFHNPDDEYKLDWDGTDDVLTCAVSMRPSKRTAKAEWFYNGKILDLDPSQNKEQSRYPIISWGNYTCKISNVHGTVTKNMYVHSIGCLMPIESKVTKSPLVLTAKGTWPQLSVKQHNIYIEPQQSLLFSCHNNQTKPNSFQKIPDIVEVMATCDHEDKFRVDDKIYKLSELQCKAEVAPVIQETGDECSHENTEMVIVGYNVQQPEPHFVKVYAVCFDKTNKVPLYTKVYETHKNKVRFENTVWQKYEKYYNGKIGEFCVKDSSCCLKKRQLVDELDVASGPAQSASFIDGLNSVSYWTGCNNISDTWDEVDNKIRSHISKRDYYVSGAYKYTEKNGIMVPRYLWKMVRTSRATIVIVKVNDPSPTAQDILFKTRCPSWVPKDDFTYCSSPDQFLKELMLVDV